MFTLMKQNLGNKFDLYIYIYIEKIFFQFKSCIWVFNLKKEIDENSIFIKFKQE